MGLLSTIQTTWAFVLLWAIHGAECASFRKSDSLTVQTANGPITGHPAVNRSNVAEFLGIPYAQPPIGSLRFAPPEPYNSSEEYIASDWVSLISCYL